MISVSGRTGTQKAEILCELHRLTGGRIARSDTTREYRPGDALNVRNYLTRDSFYCTRRSEPNIWEIRYDGADYGMSESALKFALQGDENDLTVGLATIVPRTASRLKDAVLKITGDPGSYVPFYVLSTKESLMRRRWTTDLGYRDRRTSERLFEEKDWFKEARNSSIPFQFVRNNISPEHTARRILQRLGIKPLS
ncbi:hypothetical protein KKD81_01015 [Patescibacteria group bacterium]|nr:hypothetical protein [Patescibacteria group bacterium]